ncbi:MAG: hypothetical protein AB8G86_05900 [Saprospiraceae bacterium]
MKTIENKELIKFVEKYNLKEEAISSCNFAMKNCLKDDLKGLGGFTINEIRLEFISHKLIFEHYLYSKPFVKTRIGLYKAKENDVYIRNLEPIGYYELDTNLNGESFDDWLITDVEKNNELEVVYDLIHIGNFLPPEYLNNNSKYFEYITYVSLCATLYQSKKYMECQKIIKKAFEFLLRTHIKNDFRKYVKWSKRYLRRIASYMEECHLIDDEFLRSFKELEILKRKTNNA